MFELLATGSSLPERVVPNSELAQRMQTSDQWIQEKIGIKERRYAASGEGVSDLAFKAAQAALSKAGLLPKDIDVILFATSTPEYQAPGSGILLQHKLGCREIPAFDIRNTSPGFLYALDLADGLLSTNRYQTALVVGAEVHSTGLDFSDRGRLMSVIFGDGAGCVLLKSGSGKGLVDSLLYSNGKDFDKLWCESPSSLKSPRVSAHEIQQGSIYPQMDGRAVFKAAVHNMSDAIKKILVKNKMNVADVSWLVSHQANLRIIESIGIELNLPQEQVPTIIEKYGNLSSASIPVLMDEMQAQEKLKPGDRLLLTSFGSGFSWGAALWDI